MSDSPAESHSATSLGFDHEQSQDKQDAREERDAALSPEERQQEFPNLKSDEHEESWEDVEDPNSDFVHAKEEIVEETIPGSGTRSPARSSGSSRTASNGPRKRLFKTIYIAAPSPPRKIPSPAAPVSNPTNAKIELKTVHIAAPGPPRKIPSPAVPVSKPTNAKLELKIELPTEQIYDGSIFVVRYVLDVFKTAIQLLRKPLSFIVFLWMFAFILTPPCVLPDGYSTAEGNRQSLKWADYPTLVDVQSTTIEQLLDESSSGSALALQIKKAEMATTDLVTLVRVSDLKSRDMLADHLRLFVDQARTAGRALNKLNSKVAGAVDGIMAVNDYALHTIEAAQSQSPPSIMQHLIPWSSSKPKSDLILATFEDSMNYLSFTMQSLISREQLSVLHEFVSREDASISSAHSELLGELWSMVGGNQRKLRGYEHHLHLLRGLSQYRKQALVHVVSALQTLTQMSEDIENLRERVTAPELTGSRIPVEVHIKSIQNGLERVKEGRSKAKVRESEAVKKILGSDADYLV
ncbi:hypothetical protein DFH09DRAFT_1361543 [Mycena vulgaris]|nr:hypothetical protein DFH09DRAFT_1361543 [Mycena vulgaris]